MQRRLQTHRATRVIAAQVDDGRRVGLEPRRRARLEEHRRPRSGDLVRHDVGRGIALHDPHRRRFGEVRHGVGRRRRQHGVGVADPLWRRAVVLPHCRHPALAPRPQVRRRRQRDAEAVEVDPARPR